MGTPKGITITETRHAWGFMVWDPSNGITTRQQITLASGNGVQTAGLVLGALLASGAATFAALGANTGNPTCGAITVGSAAMVGEYDLVMDDATHFTVYAPAGEPGALGEVVGHGAFGTAFAAGGLGFTITAGGTACVPGDAFKMPVTGTLQYAPFDPTQTNGLQNAAAILGSYRKDTTSATQQAAALVRGPARVNSSELLWGANVTTTQQQQAALTQLSRLGIQAT
jgi:hypothetical protein